MYHVNKPHCVSVFALTMFLVSASACTDPITEPDGSISNRERSVVMQSSRNEPIPERPDPRPWIPAVRASAEVPLAGYETSDRVLNERVAESNGVVYVGLKPPSARPTYETGIVPAMTSKEVLAAHKAIEEAGGEIIRTYATVTAAVVRIAPEKASALRGIAHVNYVAPPVAIPLQSISAPVFQQDTSWGVHKVHVPEVWGYNTGHNASITMLDSGVDQDHLFTGDGPARLNLSGCWYITPHFDDCWDDIPHGTHVAGIMAAHNDSEGVIGIAHYGGLFGLPFASVKVCGEILGVAGCPLDAIVAGIDWAASNGFTRQIVNMSLGATDLTLTEQILLTSAIGSAHNAGILLVAAAGNDRENNNPSVSWPARLSQVIAVSGTLPDDSFADWITCPTELRPQTLQGGSVFGSQVELSAPFWAKSMWSNGDYEVDCGTSMAAPVVSAIAALLWTRNPSWTRDQVRTRLRNTAVDLPPAGKDQHFGYGRVDALRALGPSVGIAGPSQLQPFESGQWFAQVSGGLAPYTFEWRKDGIIVGSGSSYSTTAGDDFQLSVTISDGVGNPASNSMSVTILSCPPPEIICE